ncbi:MAG: hypothetical protein KGM24_00475 [Elusimicrobia bacterium]|nr:hypothetical protein [Elusimicrobiota bacterium]
MLSLALATVAGFAHAATAGDAGTVTVRASTVSARYLAYAQVEPPLAWGNSRPAGCPASGGLWLKAAFYGTDLDGVRPGLKGVFVPAGSGRPVPVRVCAKFGLLRADGGESAALLPVSARPGWRNGLFGTVTLDGPVVALPAVPTRALILDRGRWWVVVRTSSGDEPRQVRPGPARGWETFIESGLSGGERVVVAGAYLEYHRGVSKAYQPPD